MSAQLRCARSWQRPHVHACAGVTPRSVRTLCRRGVCTPASAAASALPSDAVVIGAGVVGLAVARALALRGREVVVLEEEAGVGSVPSSRNSEVVHGGLYYAHGSLKARACVRGKQLLYTYAAERGVPHRRCGKLIVAIDDAQRTQLGVIRGAREAH